uniref:Calcineurin-like phosphoesterase domain-containing protein n=1 Tax=Kalanchoe fedtschenkoi TaxID=63787 RepID=A0A7N0U6E0_KALFE
MWNIVTVLCVVWVLTLLYGEMLVFWLPSLWACSWPQLHHPPSNYTKMNSEGSSDYSVRVAVIADPQLMDRTSHGRAPKSLSLEILQFYTDLFIRRSYLLSIRPLKPDTVLFLGDYFDGGPILSDEEWQDSLNRFRHVFDLNTRRQHANSPIHYFISGNHDVDYAISHPHKLKVIERYEKEFGKRNYVFRVGKLDFVSIDAQDLDGNMQDTLTSTTWEFVKNVSKDGSSNPRVLLTHIPLYRRDKAPCGPHRTSNIVNQRIVRAPRNLGVLYQNYITEESSRKLLDLIQPVMVLSGHDHDHCTVTHMTKTGPVVEHTLATISMQQGNFYPSFMLLSANGADVQNATDPTSVVATELCSLPVQLLIYFWYAGLLVVTILILLFWPASGVVFWPRFTDFLSNIRRQLFGDGTAKEKNEDENCEYEMIWDAEGSMHLVKKAAKPTSTRPDLRDSVERGGATMRAAAKKHASAASDVNIDVGSDPPGRQLLKSGKSKTRLVIQRFIRVLRMLSVIAVVNVPLYMMLLFKDWIN